MPKNPEISVIIPTLGRGEALKRCLGSLRNQSFTDFEVILVKEKGPLSSLRNKGAKKSFGRILVFIDDDVICDHGWLQSIISTFNEFSNVKGVSGPSIITSEFRRNRDLFRFRMAKNFYDLFFCDGRQSLPGHIMPSGAWTTGASECYCSYEGEVHFLEACNMAFDRNVFNDLGGFDEAYKGVGDWSEPDLSFRIRRLGYKLWFSRDARVEHQPSRSGAFGKRHSDKTRLSNYLLFAKRWVRPSFKHELYKIFLRIYYAVASFK